MSNEIKKPDKPKHHVLKAEPGFYGLHTKPKLPLRCGRCGGRTFQVIVTTEEHLAKVAGALCKCGNYFEVGEHGYLNSTGEVTVQHGEHDGSVQ